MSFKGKKPSLTYLMRFPDENLSVLNEAHFVPADFCILGFVPHKFYSEPEQILAVTQQAVTELRSQ